MNKIPKIVKVIVLAICMVFSGITLEPSSGSWRELLSWAFLLLFNLYGFNKYIMDGQK